VVQLLLVLEQPRQTPGVNAIAYRLHTQHTRSSLKALQVRGGCPSLPRLRLSARTLTKLMVEVRRSKPLVARKTLRSSAMGRLSRPQAVSETEAPNASHECSTQPALPPMLDTMVSPTSGPPSARSTTTTTTTTREHENPSAIRAWSVAGRQA
jgi:hypothetical protein